MGYWTHTGWTKRREQPLHTSLGELGRGCGGGERRRGAATIRSSGSSSVRPWCTPLACLSTDAKGMPAPPPLCPRVLRPLLVGVRCPLLCIHFTVLY